MAVLSLCPHVVVPLWVSVSSPPLLMDTSQIGLGLTHVTSFYLNYLFIGPISHHILRSWILGPNRARSGGHHSARAGSVSQHVDENAKLLRRGQRMMVEFQEKSLKNENHDLLRSYYAGHCDEYCTPCVL